MASVPPFGAVVFDLDGTLVDTLPDIHEALNRALDEAGLSQIAEAECRLMIGGGARNLIEQAYAAIGEIADEAHIDALFERFLALYEAEPAIRSRPFSGAVEALETLQAQGIALGVCTNKPQRLSELVLEGLGMNRFFGDAVIGGDALPVRKPDAAHLLEVLRRMSQAAETALLVGDSATDVATARNAALPVIAVDFGYTDRPAAQLGADALISHFDELLAAIERL